MYACHRISADGCSDSVEKFLLAQGAGGVGPSPGSCAVG